MKTEQHLQEKKNGEHHPSPYHTCIIKLMIYFSLYLHKSIIISLYKCAYNSCVWFSMEYCAVSIPLSYFKRSSRKNTNFWARKYGFSIAHITSPDSQDSHHFLSCPFPQGLDIINSTYSSCSRTFISPMFCTSKHHCNTHFLDTALFIFWRVLLIKLHGKVNIFTYAFYTFGFLWPNCFPKDSYQHNCH